MPFPKTEEEINLIKESFWKRWDFPNCVGCIDGKHVRIRNPHHSGSMFRNYKQFFSIVLQGVAGPDYKFIAIDVGAYGKESDGGIFSNSNLSDKLESGALGAKSLAALPGTTIKVPHVLLGDEAYPLKTYLMRPFPREHLTPPRRIFNQRLSRARQVIECSFGIISSKWTLLHKGIDVEPDFADMIVKAICLLHNIVIDLEGEEQISKYLDATIQAESANIRFASLGENRSSFSAYNVREKFMAYFCEN
ncbi:protein ALP1-like [Coccinella septempunctata]|uniref:protein ALP1-like n=1 Tax=Coccinella septempunctata TaxID=41139 RepID=UPI001D081A1F|nr:protein ALP1-like [Coccinella septempunctata]